MSIIWHVWSTGITVLGYVALALALFIWRGCNKPEYKNPVWNKPPWKREGGSDSHE